MENLEVSEERACEITQEKNLMQVKVKELGKVYPFLQTNSHLPWDTTELFTLSVLSLPIKKQATFSIPDPRPSTWKALTPPTHFSGNLLTSHGPV